MLDFMIENTVLDQPWGSFQYRVAKIDARFDLAEKLAQQSLFLGDDSIELVVENRLTNSRTRTSLKLTVKNITGQRTPDSAVRFLLLFIIIKRQIPAGQSRQSPHLGVVTSMDA